MTNENYYAVIMAGGVGSRLWPFSRTNYPKQFHDILGTGKTLLQQTVNRFKDVCPIENVYIVTNEIYRDLVKEQIPALKDEQILLEPIKRNTAPCIAYAAYKIIKKNPKANMIVAPADQVILQENRFTELALQALAETQEKDILVSLGIQPTRPDTGYGYIQYDLGDKEAAKKVVTFTEKPQLEKAKEFLASGDFVWNAGIFVWNAKAIVKAFDTHMKEWADIFESAQPAFYTDEEAAAVAKAYNLCKGESIDYGIMEKAQNVHVILCDFDWSDLGTWKSLYENSSKDDSQNVITGQVIAYDTQNSIIKTPEDKLVVVQGLDNFIVAEYDQVLLICNKDQEQRVKEFVKAAKEKGERFV